MTAINRVTEISNDYTRQFVNGEFKAGNQLHDEFTLACNYPTYYAFVSTIRAICGNPTIGTWSALRNASVAAKKEKPKT